MMKNKVSIEDILDHDMEMEVQQSSFKGSSSSGKSNAMQSLVALSSPREGGDFESLRNGSKSGGGGSSSMFSFASSSRRSWKKGSRPPPPQNRVNGIYFNTGGSGFLTGFDTLAPEEISKRKSREERWNKEKTEFELKEALGGIDLAFEKPRVRAISPPRPEKLLQEKALEKDRVRKIVISDPDAASKNNNSSLLGIGEDPFDDDEEVSDYEEPFYNDFACRREDIPKRVPRNFHTLHVYGTDLFSSDDVFEYFEGYGPSHVEWLNESSCNVVWTDEYSCKRAFFGVGEKVANFEYSGLQFQRKTDMDAETLYLGIDAKENAKIRTELLRFWQKQYNENCKFPSLLKWRIGKRSPNHNNVRLLIRYATAMDVLPMEMQDSQQYSSRREKFYSGSGKGGRKRSNSTVSDFDESDDESGRWKRRRDSMGQIYKNPSESKKSKTSAKDFIVLDANEIARRKKRAERFGEELASAVTTKPSESGKKGEKLKISTVSVPLTPEELEKRKKRAERFNNAESPILTPEEVERRKQRADRFAAAAAAASTSSAMVIDSSNPPPSASPSDINNNDTNNDNQVSEPLKPIVEDTSIPMDVEMKATVADQKDESPIVEKEPDVNNLVEVNNDIVIEEKKPVEEENVVLVTEKSQAAEVAEVVDTIESILNVDAPSVKLNEISTNEPEPCDQESQLEETKVSASETPCNVDNATTTLITNPIEERLQVEEGFVTSSNIPEEKVDFVPTCLEEEEKGEKEAIESKE